MAELVERRHSLPCIRDFLRGCGPRSAADWKSEEAPPLPAAARSTVVEPPAVPGPMPPDEEAMIRLVSAPDVEIVDFAEPQIEGSPVRSSGSTAAAGIDREVKTDRGTQGSPSQDDRAGRKASGVCGTDGSSKDQCVPWRIAASAVRDFPIGCGPGAPRMTGERVLKLAAAASHKSEGPIVDELRNDQQPMATKIPTDHAHVPADNEAAEGMKERIEVRNIEQETFEEVKRLEAEKNELVVKSTSAVAGVPEKRLNDQAVESLVKNLEAETSRYPPGSDILVYKKRPSSKKSTDREVLIESKKVCEIIERNLSDEAADHKDPSKMDLEQHAENLKVHGERVIIQALMASPNCLWRQGKRSCTHGSRSVSTTKSKTKR